MAKTTENDNLILKIQEGELFKFFDSEERKTITVGSRRTDDICIKSQLVSPAQLVLFNEGGAWYVRDDGGEGARSEILLGGRRLKRNPSRLDGDITIRRAGDKKTVVAVLSAVRRINRRHNKKRIDLTERSVTFVGSGEGCDVVVDNPLVEKKHFFIVYDGRNCDIEDCKSSGGTYVNNKKVRRAKLSDYDRISIPSAAYTFYGNKLLFSTSAAGIQIDVAGISKEVPDRTSRRKTVTLVRDVTFRIEAGSFVAVVGGSGAGKSTILDCINGIRPATSGKIFYDTNDYYENINSYKGVIGYVPQKDVMHDDLTVENALYYTALLRMRTDMERAEVMEWVYKAIEDVKLAGKEKLKISSLSGGQKKRVSIAMELLSDPKVIFLDEPTSGLSPDLDLEMMELLRELAKKGRTIVVITHAMENLDKCDKVAFLGCGGRLCYYGKQADVFAYFNKKSYSRIFAALSDERTAEIFEAKYRAGDYYREISLAFEKLYGGARPKAEAGNEEV